MRKRRCGRGLASWAVGLTLGLLLGLLVSTYRILAWDTTRETRARPRGTEPQTQRPESSSSSDPGGLLFVGVMTARRYLDTRAKAVYETWGKELQGDDSIAFFSSESSTAPVNCPDLPVVALPRVDDSYPPQKKSFMMLHYMWYNYGDRFEWFMRADDDVYVRVDRLEMLLRSVDSRKPMYIGQAGRGNSEEFGLLSLEYDENFCMGGPGVILSRETLRRIVPHIKYCLGHLYTTHEDVELGRCVQKYAGIPCTWNYEMQSILYHNSSGDRAFTGNLKRKEVHRAITLHPIKSPRYMYRLHNYMRGLKIQDLQQEKINLHRDVYAMTKELGINVDSSRNYELADGVPLFPLSPHSQDYPGDTEILGVPAGLRNFKPAMSDEVVPWDFISKSEYSLSDSNPRRRIRSDVKEALEDITREVMASINACSRQRGRIVEERNALYGYRRVNSYGADTILDLLLVYRKYRGRKVTLPVRRHIYLHQHFTGVEVREVAKRNEWKEEERSSQSFFFRNAFLNFNLNSMPEERDPRHEVIHFILPLSGRLKAFQRFLKNYEEVCLSGDVDTTTLSIILYRHTSQDSYDESVNLIESLKYKYRNANIQVTPASGEFSRAKALHEGASKRAQRDLLFFVDVDIVFAKFALDRVRANTVAGRQVYFPIVFSQYRPKNAGEDDVDANSFTIDETSGYWRQFGFGIVSLYKQDYDTVGGFDLTIRGWGKEDVLFFERVLKSNVEIFRAPDRHLIHVYHDVECREELSNTQLAMCIGTKADTYAGLDALAKMIYDNPEYLRFAKERRARLERKNGS